MASPAGQAVGWLQLFAGPVPVIGWGTEAVQAVWAVQAVGWLQLFQQSCSRDGAVGLQVQLVNGEGVGWALGCLQGLATQPD